MKGSMIVSLNSRECKKERQRRIIVVHCEYISNILLGITQTQNKYQDSKIIHSSKKNKM